ncbi:phage tail tape measure protein [Rhodococcus ruber]|uniref:phage tail tape measure protein n=1 Tax=Rhodococcus ruber TaxID=1830 RepID=UPI003783B2C8
MGELVARLTMDDSRFTRSAQQAERRMDDLGAAARQAGTRVEGALQGATRQADRLDQGARDARQGLGRIGDTSRDIDRVRDSARDAEREVGRIGSAAERAGGGLQSLAGSISERAGGEGGASFVGAFTERIGGLGKMGGPIGASLVGVVAIGAAAGAALAEGVRQGMEQQRQLDLFGAQTGATEEQAKAMGQAAADAYSKNFGESVDANLKTLRMATQQGIIDPSTDRQNASEVIAAISGISAAFESETEVTAKAMSSLVSAGLVDDWTEAADLLSAAVDGSANRAGDLVEVVDEYAAGWKNAGISAEMALGLIEQSTDAGAWNADVAGDALREFGRRVSEEGEAVSEALTGMGLDGEAMLAKLRSGGEEGNQAFVEMLDTLHKIEDPIERNTAVAGLLGDTAGDFYKVFGEFDPRTAVSALGQIEGATGRLNERMASNPASDVQEAFRTLEVAGNDLKLALAEGFGPGITDFANWVKEHKPELISFFTDLVDGALLCAEGIARFVSTSIDVVGPFAAIMSEAFASALDTMGTFVGAAATVADAIGMDGMADDLRGAAGFLDEYSTKAQNSSDMMLQLGDVIDTKAIPALQNIRAGVREAGDEAANSETMMRALGNTIITGVPNDKTIVIQDNSPEAVQRLRDLGFQVETTPNGIRVTANTGEAETIITDFIRRERSAEVTLRFRQDQESYWAAMGAANPSQMQGPTPYRNTPGGTSGGGFADGKLPDEALIAPGRGRGLVQWAEAETEGEAFIPMAAAKRRRSERILQTVAERFGLGLVKMADGGIVEGMTAVAAEKFPALTITDTYRPGANDHHGAGKAIDMSNGSGNTDEMLAAANYIADNYPNSLELIYDDPRFNRQIKNGQIVGRDFYAGAGDHTNHVHWAMPEPPGPAAAQAPSGTWSGEVTGADNPGIYEGPLPRTGRTAGVSDGGAVLSTDGTRVFVTNWPASLGGTAKPEDERTPILTAGLKVFANGGVEDHTAQIAPAGAMRLWAEEETGGEAYIPLAASKRTRSVGITAEVARRFGYRLVPMADGGLTGFGGYAGDDRSWLDIPLDGSGEMSANRQRANAYNALALGVGGLFALASGFDADGRFTGQFDTGANSHPALEKGFGEFSDATLELLQQILEAARTKTPVDVQVELDRGTGMANIEITKRGL